MASCNDLDQELKQIEQELAAIESTKRGIRAKAEIGEPRAKGKTRVLKTYDGKSVGIDSDEWVGQVELDALRMGDEKVRELVRSSIEQKTRPNGRTGRMVNYSDITPDKENLATLLEVMGETRAATKKGAELKATWTQDLASKELQVFAARTGGDPAEVAASLGNRMKGLKKLPATVYMAAKAKWDTATQYADALDELADAIDGGYLVDDIKHRAANIAQWAYTFEQIDAFVGTTVGRALVTRRFNQDFDLSLVDAAKGVKRLTLDEIKANSLVADMLRLTAEGNAKELRKRAAAKRLNQSLGGGVNESGFMADIRLLSYFRRQNLLSSFSSWAIRNPLSGALVQAIYMAEDTVSGTIRAMGANGLKPGALDGLQASSYAWKNFNSTWGMAWGNASEAFRTGRGTMGDENLKFVDQPSLYEQPKELINGVFERFQSDPAALANPVNWLNLMNASVWKVFGMAGEAIAGTDAGYALPFRALNAGDEFVRTQAYVWKANHEAFIRASNEGRAAGKNIEWIQQRADELTDGYIHEGLYTDDMLAEYRNKQAAAGALPGGDVELPNDELRALLYDKYHNAPNKEMDIAQVGISRGEDVTFTKSFDSPILAGMNQMRSHVAVGWLVPFFKVPINGIGWVLNREILLQGPRQLLMEGQQAFSRNAPGGPKFTPEEMADARARTVVAMGLAATTHMLWETGAFTDGGGFDPKQRDRSRRVTPPYAFSLAGTLLAAGKFRGSGIDVIDLMGLHADVLRAWSEGLMNDGDAGESIRKIMMAHAEMLKNRAALKNITDVMNWAQDPERYDLGQVIGSQFGGLLPASGLLGNATRSVSDPEEMQAPRRAMTPNEMAMIRKDPLWKIVGPVWDAMNLVGQSFVSAHANYPVVGMLQPREKDWLGNKIERPLGLPVDLTIPFMPVIKPQDPLYKWLEFHGFADKPRPEGRVKEGNIELQMTTEEENFYRETMRTVKGEVSVKSIGVSDGRIMSIDQFVIGNDLQGALRALMRHPQYNALLDIPDGGISPSLGVQPGKSLAERKDTGGGDLYAPVDAIIKYYDKLALLALMRESKFSFKDRLINQAQSKQGAMQQFLEGVSALGVGRL